MVLAAAVAAVLVAAAAAWWLATAIAEALAPTEPGTAEPAPPAAWVRQIYDGTR